MPRIPKQYVDSLPEIYRDILSAFPRIEPARRPGFGLAYQTLFTELETRYSLGEIIEACQQMAQGGAVEIKNRMFVHPTETGEEIISLLTGKKPAESPVAPFPNPPS